MRKLLLVLLSSLFLMACSTGDDTTSKNEDNGANEVDETEESGIEVDKGLLNVEITLPEMFFEEDDLAEIEAEMEESHDANVTKNDDGSISVKMSKKEHKQLMKDMNEELMELLDGIKDEEEYSSIKDVTYNKDFSNIKITVDREAYENSFDGFALISVGFSSLFYQMFDGKDIEKEKVTMELIDESTGESFDEVVYPDVFDEMEELLDEEDE